MHWKLPYVYSQQQQSVTKKMMLSGLVILYSNPYPYNSKLKILTYIHNELGFKVLVRQPTIAPIYFKTLYHSFVIHSFFFGPWKICKWAKNNIPKSWLHHGL